MAKTVKELTNDELKLQLEKYKKLSLANPSDQKTLKILEVLGQEEKLRRKSVTPTAGISSKSPAAAPQKPAAGLSSKSPAATPPKPASGLSSKSPVAATPAQKAGAGDNKSAPQKLSSGGSTRMLKRPLGPNDSGKIAGLSGKNKKISSVSRREPIPPAPKSRGKKLLALLIFLLVLILAGVVAAGYWFLEMRWKSQGDIAGKLDAFLKENSIPLTYQNLFTNPDMGELRLKGVTIKKEGTPGSLECEEFLFKTSPQKFKEIFKSEKMNLGGGFDVTANKISGKGGDASESLSISQAQVGFAGTITEGKIEEVKKLDLVLNKINSSGKTGKAEMDNLEVHFEGFLDKAIIEKLQKKETLPPADLTKALNPTQRLSLKLSGLKTEGGSPLTASPEIAAVAGNAPFNLDSLSASIRNERKELNMNINVFSTVFQAKFDAVVAKNREDLAASEIEKGVLTLTKIPDQMKGIAMMLGLVGPLQVKPQKDGSLVIEVKDRVKLNELLEKSAGFAGILQGMGGGEGAAPAENTPAAEAPAEDTPAAEAPDEDTPATEAPAEEKAADAPAEENTPATEAPAEEKAAEAPAEENTPAAEAPAEEKKAE